jgi:hypothetical protein
MPYSNFPNGFANGITVRGMPLTVAHPGKVFWVGNAANAMLEGHRNASDGNRGTFDAPFSTLDYAIGQCRASRGDIIFVKPGHAENLGAAAAIVSDIAGVAVVGLGTGSLRPKFSWTAAAADWDMTANNLTFVNVEFQANFADVASGIDVSGVTGLSFIGCYFTEAGTDLNWVDVLDFATGAADISFENCKFIASDAANDSFITGVDFNGFYMKGCYLAMNTAQASVVGMIETSGNATNVWIDNCAFRSNIDGALWVDFNGAANGGLITNCNVSSIDTAGAQNTLDFTGGHAFNCRVAGEADAWGLEGGGTAVYNNA